MLKQGHSVRDCILNSVKVDICKNCQVFQKEFQVFSFVTKLCVALFHKWRLKKPSAVCVESVLQAWRGGQLLPSLHS